jgi:transposase
VSRRKLKTKPSSKRKLGASTAPRAYVDARGLSVATELLTAGAPLDADREVERQSRMEALKAEMLRMLAAGQGAAAIERVLTGMMALERDNERLAWNILRANRYRFGRSSEKLSREELGQLFLALGGDAAQVADATTEQLPVPAPEEPEQVDAAATEVDAPDASESPANPRKKRRRVQRMTVSPDVERVVHTTAIAEAELSCALCGRDKKIFGHIEHELITFVPAKIVVHVEKREKAGCEHCRKDVSVAPRTDPTSVIRKVDATLLAKLLADKTQFAMPVERQRREFKGMGLDIPDKTLASYWAHACDLVDPVGAATLSAVFGDEVVGLDDSHLKTLDKASKHGVFRGHLWCFVGTDHTRARLERVGYGYTPSWQADEIIAWLSAIDGYMQGDGYAGYSSKFEDEETGETRVLIPNDRRLGCGMHIRSKFHDALLANDKRAAIPLKHFADLYDIEAECKARELDARARGEERRGRSLPIVNALDAWVDDVHPKLLPKSPLRRATTYAINQRVFFNRCFQDGRFEIDNGRTERHIRNFAVGRRNFLFTGSVRGGERLASIYTLVDNCVLLGIDPFLYLVDIIRKLEGNWPMRRLSELIPWNWVAQQPR